MYRTGQAWDQTLAPWTETARGGVSLLLCFSFAAEWFPERKKKLRSDQHAAQSNQTKSNQESHQKDHPEDDGQRRLRVRVAAAGARAAVPVQPGREGGAVRARGGAAAVGV